VYRCECTEGESEACEIDGVRVCFSIDQEVLTEQVWGPCGECVPGESRECTNDAREQGRQFCNVDVAYVTYFEEIPTPAWGVCLREDEIVCEPGEELACPPAQRRNAAERRGHT
jgi:hypothetical protein